MLINLEQKINESEADFKDSYGMTFQEFIDEYGAEEILDLTDKVVVSIESSWNNKNFPACIHNIFIEEGKKKKYKASLIYSGHIAFIKCDFEDGSVRWLYKDDECPPHTLKESIEWDDSFIYHCNINGFEPKDILTHIERLIQTNLHFNYKLEEDSVILLHGL